ncbi:hypothetical protein EP7_004310 [Isosphaeraceae bacterium EP7]
MFYDETDESKHEAETVRQATSNMIRIARGLRGCRSERAIAISKALDPFVVQLRELSDELNPVDDRA